ncbi:MAG: hypothetical protein ACE5MG_12325, partial [Candidatus Methylomirabilales bacterium]
PSALLDGTDDVFAGSGKGKGKGGGGNTANLAGGSYTISVTNNIAANGFPRGTIQADIIIAGGKGKGKGCVSSPVQDCDRILVLSSTGSFEGTQRAIDAIILVPAPGVGAVYMMDGTDVPPSEIVEIEDLDTAAGAEINGNDCNPPNAGGGPGPGPDVVGVAVQQADAVSNLEADIGVGNPGVIGVNGTGDIQVVPDAMNDVDFQAWVTSLLAMATPVGTGACGPEAVPAPRTVGTWANPQICSVPSLGADLSTFIPDGSTGAGILIINDFDPNGAIVAADITDFTYEGIVIVLGDGRFRMSGTSRIYGTLIQKNIKQEHSGETRLRMRDDSQICYSSRAIRTVQDVMILDLLAWYER